MMAERQPGAVVGGINDVCCAGELQFVKRFEKSTYPGVDVLDGFGVGVFGFGVELLGDLWFKT